MSGCGDLPPASGVVHPPTGPRRATPHGDAMNPLTPRQIDERATRICARYIETGEDRDATHCEVAGLIYLSDVPQHVAAAYMAQQADAHTQATIDLAERLRDLMVSRVLVSVEDKTSGLDPTRIAEGASLSGWMRRFLTAAVASEARNYRRARARTPIGVDCPDDSREPGALGRLTRVVVDHDPLTEMHRGEVEEIASAFAARAFAARPMARLALQAEALMALHAVPMPVRPESSARCQEVLDALGEDHTIAFRVVTDLACGRGASSPIASLFAEFTPDDLDVLAESDPRVAQTLARAAVSARPPQPRKVVLAMRERLVATCTSTAQVTLARQVLTAWLASSTTMDGDERWGWQPKSDEQQAAELAEFTALAHRLVLTGHHLASVHELSGWLMDQASLVHRELSLAGQVPA